MKAWNEGTEIGVKAMRWGEGSCMHVDEGTEIKEQ